MTTVSNLAIATLLKQLPLMTSMTWAEVFVATFAMLDPVAVVARPGRTPITNASVSEPASRVIVVSVALEVAVQKVVLLDELEGIPVSEASRVPRMLARLRGIWRRQRRKRHFESREVGAPDYDVGLAVDEDDLVEALVGAGGPEEVTRSKEREDDVLEEVVGQVQFLHLRPVRVSSGGAARRTWTKNPNEEEEECHSVDRAFRDNRAAANTASDDQVVIEKIGTRVLKRLK